MTNDDPLYRATIPAMGQPKFFDEDGADAYETDTMSHDGELTIWHPEGICEREGDTDADGEWVMARNRDSWTERSEMR